MRIFELRCLQLHCRPQTQCKHFACCPICYLLRSFDGPGAAPASDFGLSAMLNIGPIGQGPISHPNKEWNPGSWTFAEKRAFAGPCIPEAANGPAHRTDNLFQHCGRRIIVGLLVLATILVYSVDATWRVQCLCSHSCTALLRPQAGMRGLFPNDLPGRWRFKDITYRPFFLMVRN